MEYVSGGSIHKLLQEYGPFKESGVQNYNRQILSGKLHERNTLHSYLGINCSLVLCSRNCGLAALLTSLWLLNNVALLTDLFEHLLMDFVSFTQEDEYLFLFR